MPRSAFCLFFLFLVDSACFSLAKPQPVTPPTVAVNEQVRKSPPCTTSAETRGRTRISVFDDLTNSLVDETISIYQTQTVAVEPWPSTAKNWESIRQGWIEVCASRNVRNELDDEDFKS